METKLARISQLSKENPDMVFTSLGHLINKEMLENCHVQMDGTKAVGIDGVTKEEYGRNLEENLEALIESLKKKSYKPKPARLVEIPKDNGKMRPLSIYCYEDKLVQEALRRILEAVFEPMFYDEMMGFRPNRGCHKAIRKLNIMLERKPTNYVLDADIKGFFQHLDHEWIVRFIESRIKDPNIIRLVRRMLKAGIMNNYEFEADKPSEKSCLKCNKCVKYCPGNAILGNFEIDPRKCLSYITQKKEELSESEIQLLKENGKVFGCDICQDVCPHNKDIQTTKICEFNNELITKINQEEIDEISNKEFKRRYKNRAFSWRGRKIIKRNLDIISDKNKMDF